MTLFAAAIGAVAVIAVLLAWRLYKKNRQLKAPEWIDDFTATPWTPPTPWTPTPWDIPTPAPPKSAEQERAEHLDRQLEAVIGRQGVCCTTTRLAGEG